MNGWMLPTTTPHQQHALVRRLRRSGPQHCTLRYVDDVVITVTDQGHSPGHPLHAGDAIPSLAAAGPPPTPATADQSSPPPPMPRPRIGMMSWSAAFASRHSAAEQGALLRALNVEQPRWRDNVSLTAPDGTATMVPDGRHRHDPVHGWVHGMHPGTTEDQVINLQAMLEANKDAFAYSMNDHADARAGPSSGGTGPAQKKRS